MTKRAAALPISLTTDRARARRLARLVHWDFTVTTGKFRWSEDVTAIFGIPTDPSDTGIDALLRWVHHDDRISVARAIVGQATHRIEYRLSLPDGSVRKVHQEVEVVGATSETPLRLLGAVQDVTALREAEQEVLGLAYFDSLTTLPNRTLLRRFLDRSVTRALEASRPLAVLAVDLDEFKQVNDNLGHAAGDALLQEVAARLLRTVRTARTREEPDERLSLEEHLVAPSIVARLGGDEFIVVLTELSRPEDAANVARRAGEAVRAGFAIQKTEVFVSSSIGIACLPENGRDVDELLERADAAMYHAKERGRNNFQFYNAGLHEKARRRMAVEAALRATMVREGILPAGTHPPKPTGEQELFLRFQPKVAVPSGCLAGAEALLEWRSHELGPVSASELVPIAEDSGLVVPLGEWVMDQACAQAARWIAEHGRRVRMAVNVSGRQLRSPDFVARTAAILSRTGVPAELLELEITEDVVMQDTADSSRILDELKGLGLRITLDDFGTGYSSLRCLASLPVDALKIDRSFIGELEGGGRGATIASAIMALSHGLSMDVVVEGVETEAQLDFVERHGEAEVQGLVFAPPMTADELAAWSPPPRAIAEEDQSAVYAAGFRATGTG